ncbi:UNVERIFIED_CONTAM: Commd2 [Trichonephila clavipes]
MLLILDDIHKQHLDILKNIDEKIVREFCRISIEHLFKGSNPKIASRTLRRPMEPSMLLKLQLEEENKSENIILEADPSNIIHMTQVLDQALQEAKSQHFRRIMRSIKVVIVVMTI